MTTSPKRRIKLRPRQFFLERGVEIPGHVWKEPSFLFSPQSFAITDERLQPKIYEERHQVESLERFEHDPHVPMVYAVASEPNDSRALYFAAYLAQILLEQTPLATPCKIRWERVFADFKNDLLYNEATLSMLILSNLTPNSTAVKLEKTRDLLEAYSGVPRVVVISGEDPITFFSRKLYYKVNAIFHYSAAIMKRKVEVI